jgi:hypothetical protein
MNENESESMPSEFVAAWHSAGEHIQGVGQDGVHWLRANMNPPLEEHLSFRFGNQLFFVYVEIDALPFIGTRKESFLNVAQEAAATPCILNMVTINGVFKPAHPGWGLLHATEGNAVNPDDLVSDQLIEMSDWELHDFSIQFVRSHLENEGKKVFTTQPSFHSDPSIWFEEEGNPCWVVVRAARYPKKLADRPANLQDIKDACSSINAKGYFASVVAANADNPFDVFAEFNGNYLPLYRGQGLTVQFDAVEPV